MNFRYAAVVVLGLAALCARAADVGQGASAPTASTSAPAQTASGPTPFPKDAKDWPGKGAIRVFGYMNEYRNSYWRERERKQGSVVFVGDSLVGGWQSLAEDLPGVPVANRGIGGEPTRVLLFRFKEDVLDLHPKAIVLLSGTNDLSAQQDIAQTRSNLVDMLAMAAHTLPGVPVILCTLPPRNAAQAPIDPNRLIELNKLIVSLADERTHVVVLDLYALVADPDGAPHAEYFGGDKLHLSRAGQKRWRDALVPILKRFNLG
ncbi:MAG: GDSL-type esterase/lipase family protein [Burkholderiales bacterium]